MAYLSPYINCSAQTRFGVHYDSYTRQVIYIVIIMIRPLWFPTHWGRHKTVAILQTTFSVIFLNEKYSILNKHFIEMFFTVQLTINRIESDDGLESKWQTSIWTNDGLVYWRNYASLGLDESITVHILQADKQRVLMHGHQGWNVRHGLCHIYMIYGYIWVVYSFCLFCCLFIIVTTQFVALYKPCKPKPKPSTFDNIVLTIYPQYWYWKTHKDIL